MDIELEALAANGYTVVRKLVPEPLCDALVAAITQTFGFDPGDPETWYPDPRLPWDVVPLWGHQAQWDIRQHPPLHKVWAEVWGTDRLTVTLDRCRFTPPWRKGRPVELPIY